MSDFGSARPNNWLTDAELNNATCAAGPDCLCTGRTCRMVREIYARRRVSAKPSIADVRANHGYPALTADERSENLDSHLVQVARVADAMTVDNGKVKLDTGDPDTRAVWESALAAKREVASWPAWKRGESTHTVTLTSSELDALRPVRDHWGAPESVATGAVTAERQAALAVLSRLLGEK